MTPVSSPSRFGRGGEERAGVGHALTPYLSMLSARFRMGLQYRSAAFAGLCTQLFWGMIRIMIFTAFYRSTTHAQSMTLSDTTTYVWLGQAMFALLPWQVDTEVQSMIKTGTVAYEMLRPVDIYWLWFSRALAQRIAPTVLRAVPMLTVAALLLHLKPPATWQCGLAWVTSTILAAVLGSAISALMTISLLWTISGDGVSRLLPAIAYTLSGMDVPLVFFPAWSQSLLFALPFRDLVDLPFRLYLGKFAMSEWPALFGQELAWIAALVLLGRFLLAIGRRRLVLQGG